MKIMNSNDLAEFEKAIKSCSGQVELRSVDGDVFNLKSLLSRTMAFAELIKDEAGKLELFCYDKSDEGIMMKYFAEHKHVLA